MPHAVKLTDSLVEDARAVADRESRSIAGQIEHWARLGRAVEESLASPDLRALQEGPDGAALATALSDAFDPRARSAFAAELRGRVTYGTDPAFPGYLVRFGTDGSRTPGRLVDREFSPIVPEAGLSRDAL